jgi:hypothetical protein
MTDTRLDRINRILGIFLSPFPEEREKSRSRLREVDVEVHRGGVVYRK